MQNGKTKKPITKKSQNCDKDVETKGSFKKGRYLDKEKKNFSKVIENDPSWYAQNPDLLKDVASYSFASISGLPTNQFISAPVDSNFTVDDSAKVFPGIQRIALEPSLGTTTTGVGGNNNTPSVAARNLYSFIRHANSGSANYESMDLYMMIMAHLSAQAWLADLRRVYGCLSTYAVFNRYQGKLLVQAMGFDYDDLSSNMADFRAFIRISANKLNSIKIPSGLSVGERWKWISSHIWRDHDSAKAQLYFYQFDSYLKFSGYSSETGTELIPTRWGKFTTEGDFSTPLTLADIKEFTNQLIDPLYYEEDVGIMSGDIIKAFGEAVSNVDTIDDLYVCVPEYSEEVLNQIHNIKFVVPIMKGTQVRGYNPALAFKTFGTEIRHTITQNDGNSLNETFKVVNTIPQFSDASLKIYDQGVPFLYNTYIGTRPEDVIVGTRLVPVTKGSAGMVDGLPIQTVEVVACGTEIPLYAVLFNNASNENISNMISYGLDINETSTLVNLLAFDWKPRTLLLTVEDSVEYATELHGYADDIQNYTLLSVANLTAMHSVAVLSELAWTPKTKLS